MNIQGRPREINISKFDSGEVNTNCEDKGHQSGKCPELIIKREGATKITSILMDTGAESNILGLEALEQVLQVSREEITPLSYNLSLRGTTGLRCNAILGRVTVSLSFLLEASQKNAEFDQHKWVTSKVTFLVADPSVNLRHIIVGIPFLRMHFVSLHFNPRPKVSAMFSDAPNGRRSRVNLKLKSDTVKLHLSKPIKIEDETASFSMTNLAIEDDFVLLLKNDTNLKLPSHIVFIGFLRSDGEKSLLLNKNLELSVWTETECNKVTLSAEVFRIPQASEQRIHGSENNWNVVTSSGSSNSHDQETGSDFCTESQSTCLGLQVTDKSEIDNLDNLKYSCNLGSLPLGDQQRILNSSNDFYTNIHGVEVEDLEKYSGRPGEAEIEQDVRLCSICNVFSHKCACSMICSIFNEKRSDKISCQCDCQHVRLLATKINRSLSGGSEEQCDQENYIPTSEQVGVSDVIDQHLDSMDLRPPDPGEEVEMSHCSDKQKDLLQQLMQDYKGAFAQHRYDIGCFTGFTASIDVDPNGSHMEKERNMKVDAIRCLQPIVDNLVKHGILKVADSQGKFFSNSHGVAKPMKLWLISLKTSMLV